MAVSSSGVSVSTMAPIVPRTSDPRRFPLAALALRLAYKGVGVRALGAGQYRHRVDNRRVDSADCLYRDQ